MYYSRNVVMSVGLYSVLNNYALDVYVVLFVSFKLHLSIIKFVMYNSH